MRCQRDCRPLRYKERSFWPRIFPHFRWHDLPLSKSLRRHKRIQRAHAGTSRRKMPPTSAWWENGSRQRLSSPRAWPLGLAAPPGRMENVSQMGTSEKYLGKRLPAQAGHGVSAGNFYPHLENSKIGMMEFHFSLIPHSNLKKNRASQSGGDRKARGIFELSTSVGLRRTSTWICTWIQAEILTHYSKNESRCKNFNGVLWNQYNHAH